MPVDKKYGQVELENPRSVGEDEPVVVFRAKDKLLPNLLETYYYMCKTAGSPENHLAGIVDTLEDIRQWQFENDTQVPQSAGYDPRVPFAEGLEVIPTRDVDPQI